MITFTLDGEPVPKGRPRFSRANGKVRAFTPQKTIQYEQAIAHAAMVARASRGMPTGAVSVTVEAVQGVPASYTKAKRQEALDGLRTPRWDLDNVVKAVLDGCNGVLWLDDRQVSKITASKRYGETAFLRVTVE